MACGGSINLMTAKARLADAKDDESRRDAQKELQNARDAHFMVTGCREEH